VYFAAGLAGQRQDYGLGFAQTRASCNGSVMMTLDVSKFKQMPSATRLVTE
jgi:hypothetical protein